LLDLLASELSASELSASELFGCDGLLALLEDGRADITFCVVVLSCSSCGCAIVSAEEHGRYKNNANAVIKLYNAFIDHLLIKYVNIPIKKIPSTEISRWDYLFNR
jgi:hypothetical protein